MSRKGQHPVESPIPVYPVHSVRQLSLFSNGARPDLLRSYGCGFQAAQIIDENRPPEVAVREGAVVVTFALPEKTPGKTPAEILRLLMDDPALSVPQLAARLSKSESAVNRAIRTLRESGRLVRIGPAKGGRWKVVE